MRRERFTVVHTHCSKAGLIARVAARIAGVPVVVHTFHLFAAHDGLSRARGWPTSAWTASVRSLAHRLRRRRPPGGPGGRGHRLAPPGRIVVVPSAVALESIPEEEDPTVRPSWASPKARRSWARSGGSSPRRRRSTSSGCARPCTPSGPTSASSWWATRPWRRPVSSRDQRRGRATRRPGPLHGLPRRRPAHRGRVRRLLRARRSMKVWAAPSPRPWRRADPSWRRP